MKALLTLSNLMLILALACGLPQPALAAEDGFPSIIVLTAKDIRSAADIEAAIYNTTDAGSHPGAVFLDGMYGPIVYTQAKGDDQTINIAYSGLTLRGVNGAVLTGGNGIVLDPQPADNIAIENLTMTCNQDCITAWGVHRNVRIENNLLIAGSVGILAAQAENWTVLGNTIQAGWAAVSLVGGSQIEVQNNLLIAPLPLLSQSGEASLAAANTLVAGPLPAAPGTAASSITCWFEPASEAANDGNVTRGGQLRCTFGENGDSSLGW
jgi:hypothetical protein